MYFEEQPVQHVIHRQDGDFSKEIALTSINFSVYLKSNDEKDTLADMVKIAIASLTKIKNLEDGKE